MRRLYHERKKHNSYFARSMVVHPQPIITLSWQSVGSLKETKMVGKNIEK